MFEIINKSSKNYLIFFNGLNIEEKDNFNKSSNNLIQPIELSLDLDSIKGGVENSEIKIKLLKNYIKCLESNGFKNNRLFFKNQDMGKISNEYFLLLTANSKCVYNYTPKNYQQGKGYKITYSSLKFENGTIQEKRGKSLSGFYKSETYGFIPFTDDVEISKTFTF